MTELERPNSATPEHTMGDRLRQYRQEREWSLTELANQSGVSKGYLSTLESGQSRSRPSGDTLYALAKALGVTMSDLLGQRLLTDAITEIPNSLREFAQQEALPEADLHMLAAIRFRGEQPSSIERWRYIYQAITHSADMDRRHR